MPNSNREGTRAGYQGKFDPKFKHGQQVHGDIRTSLPQYEDAFGKHVTLGTTNEADLAGHYDYSPERYRVYVDGVRQQIQYNGFPAQFEDATDSFLLKPQTSGEVVEFKTAERYRYVVQYVLEWSLAFRINQDLQTGDVWVVGYGDADLDNSTSDEPGPSADGWFVYQNSSHATDEATLAEYRAGTAVSTDTITFNVLPQIWGRMAGSTNWYNVGVTDIEETYTEFDIPNARIEQRNETLGSVGVVDDKGPETGNQRFETAVKAGDGAGTLELEVGSIGLRTLGDVTAITRNKSFSFSEDIDATNVWIPVLAFRGDPDRPLVNFQFDEIDILEFTGSDDTFALILLFDSDNVRDTNGNLLQDANYTAPPEINPFNSVIQSNSNVEKVVDNNGTLQASMSNPGGYQVGFASLYSSGAGSSSQRDRSEAIVQKRNVPNGDIAVLMLKSPSTGTCKGQLVTEQDW